jgi:hypothetical protein
LLIGRLRLIGKHAAKRAVIGGTGEGDGHRLAHS